MTGKLEPYPLLGLFIYTDQNRIFLPKKKVDAVPTFFIIFFPLLTFLLIVLYLKANTVNNPFTGISKNTSILIQYILLMWDPQALNFLPPRVTPRMVLFTPLSFFLNSQQKPEASSLQTVRVFSSNLSFSDLNSSPPRFSYNAHILRRSLPLFLFCVLFSVSI